MGELSWVRCVFLGMLFVMDGTAGAEESDLADCFGATSTACAYDTSFVVDESCGKTFWYFRGCISWPPLVNIGPVTISVSTRAFRRDTLLPMAVEIRRQFLNDPPDACPQTNLSGSGVILARGIDQCGGGEESIGPLDLTRLGIPLGDRYYVLVQFFETLPTPPFPAHRSPGLSCIRLTAEPSGVVPGTFSQIKGLYRTP